jgi:sugar phosphate permease
MRQTLPVAIGAIQRTIHISDAQFGWLQAAFLSTYAVMYVGGGRLLDAIGTNGAVSPCHCATRVRTSRIRWCCCCV